MIFFTSVNGHNYFSIVLKGNFFSFLSRVYASETIFYFAFALCDMYN